jgi:hypothetical protein
MKRFLVTIFIALVVSGSAWSAEIDKGLAAAQKGDFATALSEWKPRAEQGADNRVLQHPQPKAKSLTRFDNVCCCTLSGSSDLGSSLYRFLILSSYRVDQSF